MSRTARIIVGLIVAVLIVVLVVLVYIWVSGGSAAPSAPLTAPTLVISTRQPTAPPTAKPTIAATSESTEAGVASTDEAAAAPTAEVTTTSAAQGNEVVFNIVPDQSEVRFILNEVLRGSPNQVKGTTNQVAGQLAIDFTNPQNSQVGEIRIDARSLSTDNELRNRAIRGQILQSAQDQFEFISFKPTSLDGLPTSVTIGQPIEFTITGDLTIRNITNPVTFNVTVTPDSQTKIEGTANAMVQRSDYGLTIPNAPGVADVDQAVRLEISFVATTDTATQAP